MSHLYPFFLNIHACTGLYRSESKSVPEFALFVLEQEQRDALLYSLPTLGMKERRP